MKCTKCGTNNPAGQKFCGECGNKLEINSMPIDTAKTAQFSTINEYHFMKSDLPASGHFEIPKSEEILGIASKAFEKCSKLISITIPDHITYIREQAFANCTNLRSVTFGKGLTHIDKYAFAGCTNLEEVHITDLEAWLKINFEGNWANPLELAHKLYVNGEIITEVSIPEGTTHLNRAFSGCNTLTKVTIPEGVTHISGTFSNCTGLTNVVLPNSVTHIGDDTFKDCYNLNINIPKGVTYIGANAFTQCRLQTVQFPNGVTHIGKEAFSRCSNLTSIYVPNSVVSIGQGAFAIGSGVFKNGHYINNKLKISLPFIGATRDDVENNYFQYIFDASRRNLYEHQYISCLPLTTLELRGGTVIGPAAFKKLMYLENVTLPNTITRICREAFQDCCHLKHITIPDSVTSIEEEAFSSCCDLNFHRYGLRSVIIGNGTKFIGRSAFEKCYLLNSVTIGSSVTSISECAFAQCTHLKQINFKGTRAQWNAISFGPNWKAGVPASMRVICADEVTKSTSQTSKKSSTGCYVATCVYGSYDCPQVWTLRRFRDDTLGATWYGRAFIRTYYAISPTLVQWFGKTTWFKKMWHGTLNKMVSNLNNKGVSNAPYQDKNWR